MIREVRPDDRDLYLKLTDMFYKSSAVIHSIPDKNRELSWDELMRCKDYTQCFIIFENDASAGYLLLSYTFSQEAGGKVAWIEEIFITPEFQGRGLGKKAFAFIKEKIEPQCARLRLEIEPDNEGAKRLYASLGFKTLGYEQMIKEL